MAKDQGGHRKLGDSISRPLRCSGFHVLSPQGPTDSPRGRDDSLANEELSFEGPVRSRAIALSKGSAASSAPFIPPITAIFLGLFEQSLQVSLRYVKPCNKTCGAYFLENPLVEPGRERRIGRRPLSLEAAWLPLSVLSHCFQVWPGNFVRIRPFAEKARIAPRPALSIGSGAEITASTETPGSNIASRSPL
jgi:hypothetical protein